MRRDLPEEVRTELAAGIQRAKREAERREALRDALGVDGDRMPLTHAELDCGCEFRCNGWERGRGDSYGTFRWIAVDGEYTDECEAHK